jgi:hypothetical protein
MANRLGMSFDNLNCKDFGLTDPVSVTLDGDGAAVAATINTTQQKATSTGHTRGGGPVQRRGRHHHLYMNPSGA